jgi:hypothetical protein
MVVRYLSTRKSSRAAVERKIGRALARERITFSMFPAASKTWISPVGERILLRKRAPAVSPAILLYAWRFNK